MGTSAPFMFFTVTSYFRVRSTKLYNLGGKSLSFFLKISSSAWLVIWVHSGGIAVDEVMEPFKSPDDAEYLTFNVKTKLRKVCRLLTFLGGFMSMIADTFLLSGLIPCVIPFLDVNRTLSLLNTAPFFLLFP